MKCPCAHENLELCGILPDGRYRYQGARCRGAWAVGQTIADPTEETPRLDWIAPFITKTVAPDPHDS